jgi:hypothetical protein
MKLALAEYKWGRDDTLSGALAAATLARFQLASGLPNVIFMDGFETGTTSNWEP